MKTIEIKTAQNVVLEYELADFRDRLLAFIIDFCILTGAMIVLLLFTAAFGPYATVWVFFVYGVFIFYSFGMEVFNKGQSLGKMAMRIQVIKTTGSQAGLSEFAARWVFRMVDIYLSFGAIASILIASSGKAQRIGDIVGNTAVVKVHAKTNLNLDDLLKLHTPLPYVPLYPAVKQLPETDMLLIKSTIDRYSKFNNTAHEEALHLMAVQVQTVLGIQNPDKDEKRFLQTILKDYVVLTR